MADGVASAAQAEPRVSVVVPTVDRARRLDRLLLALEAQTLPTSEFEVIVAVDAAGRHTADVVDRWIAAGQLSLTRVPSAGRGPTAARNAAWPLARAPLVAFVDDDCEPVPVWLEALTTEAGSSPGAIVQGRTEPNPRELERATGLVRTKSITALGPWFQTCNVLYHRELLERLGGFDSAFPFSGEDTDLAWRAIEAGAPQRFAPQALVHHAVDPLTPRGYLASALREPDEALAYRRHAGLRSRVRTLGAFRSESHALLVLAAAGALAARRSAPALALALPYARLVAARTRDPGHRAVTAPLIVGFDVLETLSAARGCVRHRVLAL